MEVVREWRATYWCMTNCLQSGSVTRQTFPVPQFLCVRNTGMALLGASDWGGVLWGWVILSILELLSFLDSYGGLENHFQHHWRGCGQASENLLSFLGWLLAALVVTPYGPLHRPPECPLMWQWWTERGEENNSEATVYLWPNFGNGILSLMPHAICYKQPVNLATL